MNPFFSIVTVTRNDVWSLTKTARSVFRQGFKDFEYVVVDGDSDDGTAALVEFWRSQGLVTRAISERDSGVYNAMNKGLQLARGDFVCFLNAGDVFAGDDLLSRVHALLGAGTLDGALGWGELNGQVWASWAEHPAFKLASLGFCHQSLFVRRDLLLRHRFDERPHKTDSDTLQLGRLYAAGADIAIVPEVWAVRGGEPGISANLERTKASIVGTLREEYGLDAEAAESIVAFRRQCAAPERMAEMLRQASEPLREHLALMVLDTLFLRQSAALDAALSARLFDAARSALDRGGPEVERAPLVERLLQAQGLRQLALAERREASRSLQVEIATFGQQESARIAKWRSAAPAPATGDFVVSLTSFPARLATLHLVVQSLLAQTLRPAEIHLWLGQDEVPARHWLPRALLDLEPQGLHVHFARRTCHQYDKFLHNAGLNDDRPFVIVDDDVIYPPHSMASLLAVHERHPQAIVANRCHRIELTGDGGFAPYATWPREVQADAPSLRAFPTGAGGVLYPAGFFSRTRATRVDELLARAPYADDIWLKACAIAHGIRTVSTALSQGSQWYLRYTPTMRAGALHATNVDLGLNDMQLRRSEAWLDHARPDWRRALLAET